MFKVLRLTGLGFFRGFKGASGEDERCGVFTAWLSGRWPASSHVPRTLSFFESYGEALSTLNLIKPKPLNPKP